MPCAADRSVLFLVAEAQGPSTRFRVLQYLPRLRAHGITADVEVLGPSLPTRLRALAKAARFRTVVVCRALLAPLEWRMLRRAAPRYLFDFDDAILYRDSAAARFDSWQRRARFRRMVGGAAVVIAGNDYLAGLARDCNARATVIPTAIDLEPYGGPIESPSEPTVCWIGTAINLMYLRPILPALAKVRVGGRGVKLKVVCDAFPEQAGLEIVRRPWSLASEASEIAACQAGIMPLADDPWTRGKCALKILQYFAAALPVVCSPVGSNLAVVEHGRSGYFAADDAEWIARLEELLADRAKGKAFGRAGRELVESRYSVEANVGALLSVLGID